MRLVRSLPLLLAMSLPLTAGDGTFGLGVSALSSTGNAKPLMGNGMEVDGAVHFKVGTMETGRFRLSYSSFGNGTQMDANGRSLDAKGQVIGAELDFMLPLGAEDAPLYAVLGGGFLRGNFAFTAYHYAGGNPVPTGSSRENQSDMGVGLAAGLGWRIMPHAALEVRYELGTYSETTYMLPGQIPVDVGSNHIAAGVQVRF